MWKFLKFIGALIKTAFWLAFFLAVACIVLLYVFEQDVPAPLVSRIADALSSDDYLCRIGRATYSLKSGVHLYQVKALPKRTTGNALISAEELVVDVSLQPKLEPGKRIRSVMVRDLRLPALPPPEHERAPQSQPPLMPHLPVIAPFPLTLEKADILGIQAERITATVATQTSRVDVTQVSIQWPDKTFDMHVEGGVSVDFATRLVNGNAKGQALPANIQPLLEALHARSAVQQMHYFSRIERPVDAETSFTINIDNTDFDLLLGLAVGPCAYREVPMKSATGTLHIYGTNVYTSVIIGPIHAENDTGRLSGTLIYREENGGLEIKDAASTLDLRQLFTIIDLLQHGELDTVRCDTPPTATASGIVAVDHNSRIVNDLAGHVTLASGTILKFPAKDISADFAVKGESALFEHVAGTSASGGKISGGISFFFPGGNATSTLFSTRATFSNVELADFAPVFNFASARAGRVSGSVSLVGRAGAQTIPSLAGEGTLRISDGLLNRMPLFAGFTDYLARNIPGISTLVNQSSGAMNFIVENGQLSTDDLLVEGDLFSMKGRGTCKLETGGLDFTVQANIFKEKTWAGRLTRLVTLPFTRLLLEFKVFGTLDKTDWSYVNIIEKITDGLSGLSDQIKPSSGHAPAQPTEKQP